ncbi:MAG: hypothetical protein JXA94_02535 [Parachlamydiales bacterium]|nr:hypothetical protein [Parachlamydiales bacterium]
MTQPASSRAYETQVKYFQELSFDPCLRMQQFARFVATIPTEVRNQAGLPATLEFTASDLTRRCEEKKEEQRALKELTERVTRLQEEYNRLRQCSSYDPDCEEESFW